jgi:hypothetical protein
MEDAPSDDETAAAAPSNTLPVSKQAASGHNPSTPPPHLALKGSPATSNPQLHPNIKQTKQASDSAMEDAQTDDETAAAAPSNTLPVSKQAASGHNLTTPPHSGLKGIPVNSKPQLQPNIKQTKQASKVHVSKESASTGPVHAPLVSNTAAVTAAAEDSGDEALASPLHRPSPTENESLTFDTVPTAAPLVVSFSDHNSQLGSPRSTLQPSGSGASAPVLKPVPASAAAIKLKGLPLTPRNSSDDRSNTDPSLCALPLQVQPTIQLAQLEAVHVADTVGIDMQCFAVSRRHVQPFCVPEDVPLPSELAQIEPNSALTSKIDAGEFFAPIY